MNTRRAIHVTRSARATETLGEEFARTLKPGAVVLLTGPLGAGKTTFVRGLARGVGARQRVTSPTFKLVNVYRGRITVYHADLYRIRRPEELEEIGLEEYLSDGGGRGQRRAGVTAGGGNGGRGRSPAPTRPPRRNRPYATAPTRETQGHALVVEWPDRAAGWWPAGRREVRFDILGDTLRRITVS